ncbi:MAG: Rrf2 family transcriptional regulator [Proteobacteria bacterium]|nr:MAG: Rrf2 family transcriptional regulator [Pseudomonadota bacterium]
MKDEKLSSVLHLLLHLGDAPAPLPSESLAEMNQTNPVVVRRLLAGLRKAGLVSSGKGHGGGWILERDLGKISVGDVYRALGAPAFFRFGYRQEKPTCLLEKSVVSALEDARAEAEGLLLRRLDALPLSHLAEELRGHMNRKKN